MTAVFYISCFAFGAFMAIIGYLITIYQYWIGMIIFSIAIFSFGASS